MKHGNKTFRVALTLLLTLSLLLSAGAGTVCENPNVRRLVVQNGPKSDTMGHQCRVSVFDEASREIVYAALEELK